MTKEIGSHLEYDETIILEESSSAWIPVCSDYCFTFSGRSAIELVILNIKKYKNIYKVYMPSYCCSSMVDPFLKHNIQVLYYEVFYDKEDGLQYNINTLIDCDIFFVMGYFGIHFFNDDNIIDQFRAKGTIILEDITHSLFSTSPHTADNDYFIASIRKWLPVATGGIAGKVEKSFNIEPMIDSNNLVQTKIEAMKDKRRYLMDENTSKHKFLNAFSVFESKLKNIDWRYKIDDLSLHLMEKLDVNLIIKQRQENALYLYEHLKDITQIGFLVKEYDITASTPLYFPIMLDSKQRDSLRKYLIENNIYCPIHWPTENYKHSNISKFELSLVCDQRYTVKDMEHVVYLIKSWFQ